MFPCFTDILMYILKLDICVLLSGFCTKGGFVLCCWVFYQLFYDITFNLRRYGICLLVTICYVFRHGSEVVECHWFVISCLDIFEIKKNKILFIYSLLLTLYMPVPFTTPTPGHHCICRLSIANGTRPLASTMMIIKLGIFEAAYLINALAPIY